MSGPFRFRPPPLRAVTLTRPRLNRVLQLRWSHRVTLVTGGPGMGKTTLLAQALVENELAQEGRDVWLGLEAHDDDGRFAGDLLDALREGEPRAMPDATVAAITDAIWQAAPTPVCLVVDDAHVLSPGSAGHQLLADLVRNLPANGHLLVAARVQPDLPLARLAAAGELVQVGEADLAFDADEVERLAERRGADVASLDRAGGWPAMVELAASAGQAVAREFLWQEVIEPLSEHQRRVLAALVELGGGDDALLSAALDTPVALDDAVGRVPLLVANDDGWYRPHALWRPMTRLRLTVDERLLVLQRAVDHLVDRGRFEDAFELVAEHELWASAPTVIRTACLGLAGLPSASLLERWLRTAPAEVRRHPAGELGAGVLAALDASDHAPPALGAAIAGFRDLGDREAELSAIAHLGVVAWWSGDADTLRTVHRRVHELSSSGLPFAEVLDAAIVAVLADLDGDDRGMLAALAPMRPDQLDPTWAIIVTFLRATAHYGLGDLVTALQTMDSVDDPDLRLSLETLHSTVVWNLGLDDQLETTTAAHDALLHNGETHTIALVIGDLGRRLAHLGDVAGAEPVLDRMRRQPTGNRPLPLARIAASEAALLVARGDEHGAADLLRRALARQGLDSTARRAWRDNLALAYVLVPEPRADWDALGLQGVWAQVRGFAQAVVALRGGVPADQATRSLPAPLDLDLVRANLHHRFATELAIGLHEAGRSEGTALLEAVGPPGRIHARELAAATDSELAGPATRVLAAVPALPPHRVELRVLGPLELHHDGTRVDDPALRRERVRTLLALLVDRRSITRQEAMALLWPDLDDRAAANNLRVTLAHLQRALEPWRAEGEPGYFVRTDGTSLRLVADTHLLIDLDAFDGHLAAAERAERDGTPSAALDANRKAIERWRGELHADLPDVAWLHLERERRRNAYGRALQRAGQLELARGEIDAADALGRRALEVDAWAEPAHAILIGAALARGDRSAARQALDRAHAAMADLGVPPGPEIRRLERAFEGDEAALRS